MWGEEKASSSTAADAIHPEGARVGAGAYFFAFSAFTAASVSLT